MNSLESKIRNLEASIVYIQQEHANTLKMLHDEIKDLQQRNSELSFHIAMQVTDSINTDEKFDSQSDKFDLLQQIEKLTNQIRRLSSENQFKSIQLENYGHKIRKLTETIDKLKECQKERLSLVETELNNKNAEIVMLSTKLHNWKKFELKRNSPNEEETNLKASNKPFIIPHMPVTSKIVKLRNQISVHPDDGRVRRRPIISQHAIISTPPSPVKGKTFLPLPECAISTEERTSFSKSIKQLNILPPIHSMKNQSCPIEKNPSLSTKSSTIDTSLCYLDSRIDSFHTSCEVQTMNSPTIPEVDQSSTKSMTVDFTCTKTTLHSNTKLMQVNIDRFLDFNNSSSAISPPLKMKSQIYRNHSS